MKEKLKDYMKENGLSQRQLSSLLDISESHLSRILTGRKDAGAKMTKAYYNLPGIAERETISNMYQLITNLWINNEIPEDISKILLQELKLED